MTTERVSGSYRDPSGFLFRDGDRLYRAVSHGFRAQYDKMMACGFYAEAVEQGLLIPHQEVPEGSQPGDARPYKVLQPEQVPFISYPYEWSFSQLKDAALLTLALQTLALKYDLWLKDASAYNVQFLRGRPIFIDTLSFEPYPEGSPWVAYRQFCTHFLGPLSLVAYVDPALLKLLRTNIDGIPLELTSRLLPVGTRFRPSLLMNIHMHGRAERKHSGNRDSAKKARTVKISRSGMQGIIHSLKSATEALQWEPEGTEWGNYYDETNYSEAARDHKAEVICSILEGTRPGSVADLGGNTGFFSRLASDRGIPTLSLDVDPAAVEKSYLTVREKQERYLLPLVQDLTNPTPGIGWNGDERMSLFERTSVDLGFALAIVHHLAIGNNVPLDRVAALMRRLCRHLIIEFVPKSDSQVQRLLASREDVFPDYTNDGFEAAFSRYFTIGSKTKIRGSERTLFCLEGR
ncbi:MAG: SAM-dependent methyltransferase [Myxococcales bacterium]|nr:MAG: SAM-dependent methyltransferase [Myxococcales bacterium]